TPYQRLDRRLQVELARWPQSQMRAAARVLQFWLASVIECVSMRFSLRRLLSIDLATALAGAALLQLVAIFPQPTGAGDKPSTGTSQKPKEPAVPKRRPRVTISKKTTHLVEPLDEDGYVDYLAALNDQARQNVNPATNAGVLLARATGVARLEP